MFFISKIHTPEGLLTYRMLNTQHVRNGKEQHTSSSTGTKSK